jgi:A/G-specific adenine glycosylase
MWDEKRIGGFRKKLLHWYRSHRRSLPWRNNTTPYRIWISEIMLQQTQTATVLSYYERFLQRFPDVQSLAQASESEVLNAWSGLGYYSRARNLRRAAKQIVSVDGSFPRDFIDVLHLPGIGRYTAGAICSIAFNQPYPVVDGNVRRVLTRLMGIQQHVPERYFWDLMSTWISRRAPSSFNQAMMELGALICMPLQPKCPQCPVRAFCHAQRLGIEERIPKARKKQACRRLGIVLLVLERNRRILLTTSGKNSFIPGAWGLPWRIMPDHLSKEECAAVLCQEVLGKEIRLEFCGSVRHSISNRRITGFGFHGKAGQISGIPAVGKLRWANPALLGRFLTSSFFQKVLRKIEERPSGLRNAI